jgi:hypothetical protein
MVKAVMQALDRVLREADDYFMGRSRLHEAARQLAATLEGEGIPYAIAGALALAAHGRVRLTEDVDVLLTREGLAAFKRAWLGRGYVEIGPGLKSVRDTAHDVRIDFLLSGDFPGDGKPKPVVFPVPSGEAEALTPDGFRVLDLKTLLELKLASGMTAPHRAQDLADVLALVRARSLPRGYAEGLDPFVRAKFLELWDQAQVADDY